MVAFRSVVPAMGAMMPLVGMAAAKGLADIDHVVLFMQENRAFDHYFGTMAGVRGFADPNVKYNGDVPVWKQVTNSKLTNDTDYVTPWYLNYLGGDWPEASQCMVAGDNGWDSNHAAWNHGANNHWAVDNTPWSIGFYKREDLPIHFTLAEEWVIGDMYQEAVIASTNPNRATWVSGSTNIPGSPQGPDEGGYPYIDNNETPGCDELGINCYPLKWKTAAEVYEEAGVSWQVYQDADNFDDNAFAWFEQFQVAKEGSDLHEKGMEGRPLDNFYAQAANGTLPEVSFIVGPAELSEHPPYSPNDGAWLERKIAEAVLNSPKYSKTVLIFSFDETGGWADHVDPYRSPNGTAGEWLQDPYGEAGYTFAGPGFRVPFYIISPWTRKGGVYTEHADHNSQIKFIEQWQAAKGRDVKTEEMSPWRREHMADLVNAFDFENPDFSIPELPAAKEPHTDEDGVYNGAEYCESLYEVTRPPVPYTGEGAVEDTKTLAEKGFKPVRGVLTEGRTLVFEMGSNALAVTEDAASCSKVGVSRRTEEHDVAEQAWVIHAVEIGGTDFTISSAINGLYICKNLKLCTRAESATVFSTGFDASQGHYFMTKEDNQYLRIRGHTPSFHGTKQYWNVFSVNY